MALNTWKKTYQGRSNTNMKDNMQFKNLIYSNNMITIYNKLKNGKIIYIVSYGGYPFEHNSKNFKTKAEALKFAKAYMRKY